MSEDLLFAKISEPEMTVISFDDHFRDRIGRSRERAHRGVSEALESETL